MPEVVQWNDIKDNFQDALLVGNGGSIAIAPQFSYTSLYDYAAKNNLIKDKVKSIFDKFSKSQRDFERILYRLWQADYINKKFDVNDDEQKKVRKGYTSVRRSLINSVKQIHPEHNSIASDLVNISSYVNSFTHVFSLNYDLILHWSILKHPNKQIEDGFVPIERKGKKTSDILTFTDDIDVLKRKFDTIGQSTMLFYPHGNLALYKTKATHEEKKITANDGANLLEILTTFWASNDGQPLFVCEGDSESKLKSINDSAYLRHVFQQELPNGGKSLTVYGWHMAEQDNHILKQIGTGNYQRIAVSVYLGNKKTEEITVEIQRLRSQIAKHTDIENIKFFDSASAGCWSNPIECLVKPLPVSAEILQRA